MGLKEKKKKKLFSRIQYYALLLLISLSFPLPPSPNLQYSSWAFKTPISCTNKIDQINFSTRQVRAVKPKFHFPLTKDKYQNSYVRRNKIRYILIEFPFSKGFLKRIYTKGSRNFWREKHIRKVTWESTKTDLGLMPLSQNLKVKIFADESPKI